MNKEKKYLGKHKNGKVFSFNFWFNWVDTNFSNFNLTNELNSCLIYMSTILNYDIVVLHNLDLKFADIKRTLKISKVNSLQFSSFSLCIVSWFVIAQQKYM
jgi:hypothetical protein